MKITEQHLRYIIRKSINESIFGITSHADNLTKTQQMWDRRAQKRGHSNPNTDHKPQLKAIRDAADEAFWDPSVSLRELTGFMRNLYTTLAKNQNSCERRGG